MGKIVMWECEWCNAKAAPGPKSYGGDEEWRGEWYPLTLVSELVWVDYVREMLEDCGDIPAGLPSWIELDWEATARNVQVDYTPVDYDGTTYWYR